MATWTLSQSASFEGIQGVLELFIGLTREANNDVRRHRYAWHELPRLRQPVEPEIGGIGAPHAPQHLVVTGLDWEVQVFANCRNLGHCLENSIGHVFRVRGQEPQPVQSFDRADRAQEISQIGFLSQIVAVRIDGLPKQRHVPNASPHQALNLGDNLVERAARFLATPIRNNAVGTEKIAAVDDRYIGRNSRVGSIFQIIVRKLCKIVFHLRQLRHKVLERIEVRRIEEQIDVRETLFQLFLLVGHHAARQHEAHVRACALFANQ